MSNSRRFTYGYLILKIKKTLFCSFLLALGCQGFLLGFLVGRFNVFLGDSRLKMLHCKMASTV